MIHHALISALKELAVELGRPPTRAEFEAKITGAHHKLSKVGGFSVLLQAAGLDTYRNRQYENSKKVTAQELFGKDIREIIKPADIVTNQKIINRSILGLGDTHFPFIHQHTLSAAFEVAERRQPTDVVQVGDLFDMLTHGKFPRSRNIYNPFEEISLGYEMAAAMWAKFRGLCPNARLWQILGNHDARPLKRILEHYPEGEVFFSIEKYFKFDAVTTIMDLREVLDLGLCGVTHGHLKFGRHVETMRMNVLHGHDHRLGIHSMRQNGKTLFEVSAGLMGDPFSKALSYTPLRLNNFTPGFAWWDEDGPQLIAV